MNGMIDLFKNGCRMVKKIIKKIFLINYDWVF